MLRTLGIIEYASIAKGIEAADRMVKSSQVELLILSHFCPGKFLTIICGDVEEVKIAVEKSTGNDLDKVVDSAIITNAHDELITALKKRRVITDYGAVGIFETSNITSALISLDSALKSSSIKLVKLVIGNGISGKSYFVVTGTVSCVEEAIAAAANSLKSKKIVYKTIIPSPDKEILNNL